MGGPCDEVLEGATAEEISEKAKKHVMETQDDVHKETASKMQSMSQEDHATWWEGFQKQFAEKPEA